MVVTSNAARCAEKDSTQLNKKRLHYMLAGESVAFGTSMYGLYSLWYKGYPTSSFHWFDDSKEWLQVDKAGHFFSSYHFNRALTEGYAWTGMDRKSAIIWGSSTGMVFMATIEIFDGFSAKWGASWSDIVANTAGTSLFAFQEWKWQDQRIISKFSYHNSKYAQYRPDALGSNLPEKILKDYNGETHWLSFNIRSLTGCDAVPVWLNFAAGYGAEGMLGGNENPLEIDGNLLPVFERYRQFYFSFDVDLTRIHVKSKFLSLALSVFNTLKFPFPAIEISRYGAKFQPLYF
ncbi:MAG: DUF2279 domain-containing protein [Bacteroidota bacterium]